MQLLQWIFLLGAAAVVGPIVAHLLGKPRYRRVPFTMLQFLRRGQSQRYSRRQLRDLLLLLLRCTIIVLIAILFAQPLRYVRAEPTKHRSVHWLALDDSMSMAYRDGSQTFFEQMIGMSLDYLRRAPEDATFAVYGLASGRGSQGLTKAQAQAQIKQLKPVPAGAGFTELFSALHQAARTTPPGEPLSLMLMSDFTPSVLQALERVSAPAVVDAVQYEHIRPHKPVSNTALLGARVASVRDRKLTLDVTVCHYGAAERHCTLTARSPDLHAVSLDPVTLTPGQPRVLRLQVDLGPGRPDRQQECWPIELRLTPDDNLDVDDMYRLAVCIPSGTAHTNVVVVHRGEETFLFETALRALSDSGSLHGLNLKKVPEDRLRGSDLAGADIVVFAAVPPRLEDQVAALKALVQRGGRLVFFTPDVPQSGITTRLWQEGLLPARPDRWIAETVYPEPGPAAGVSLDLDTRAAQSLVNYGIDKIALKGHWRCEPAPQAECLWRLAGGAPFVYGIKAGSGLALLVNTSIDGSLSLLAKSPAWVAFCRYLVGRDDPVQQFCFSADERPVLRIPEFAARSAASTLAIENCDDSRGTASVRGSSLFLPTPAGLGWMKTTEEPAVQVGINLPAGESDIRPPTIKAIADALQRAFVTDAHTSPVLAQAEAPVRPERLWRYVAWAAIFLLLSEAALANRLRR